MPSTYTTNNGIQKPANGEQDGTWGDTVNANMDILDRLTNGVGSITLSGTTYTLTTTNGVASPGHYKVLLLGGSPAAPVTITVSPNTAQRLYFVKNNCGQNVTFTQGSGATLTLGTGQSKIIYCDGAGSTASVSATLSNDLVLSSGTILGSTINSSPIGATTPDTGAFTTLTASGDVTIDTTTFKVDAANNRVGIGTASPAATLHTKNAFDTGSSTSVLVESTGSGSGVSPVVTLYRNSASPAVADNMGAILYQANNNSIAAVTYGMIYGFLTVPTAGGEYGGLGFQTMKNGTLSDTMILNSTGDLIVGKSSTAFALVGSVLFNTGQINATTDGLLPLAVNRLTTDGALIQFYQDGTLEGSITVSGTTVSFNGGHLSRWAQLPDGARPTLLKGTVMSNRDAMSVWPGEDNEQLNCVEVSSVQGDKDVAGVFVGWEDPGATNDMRVAMTGDMVIRIAAGATVARGDLLVSNGDGCAVPQADDIVRSSTVAKVTSTHVSATYPDGSYCVPCVLMAC